LIVYGLENIFKRVDMFDNIENQVALTILNSAKILIKNHKGIIFGDQNHQIYQDWRLSSLACHLLKNQMSIG
jgi:hypothetical protein